ncbi:hypothetical protein G7Z17_g3240 [Cylindrodendrum hubeiense]|uniref:RING-type domain-containing protein n=1 Tax=Cylindrodendrum hubeiense TaxID=595255 RepID=A0A9P5HGB1_9HYPO|nr:hypothetical protein G7Z17_g3240 [Cylindrodendrum hubeiense]
MRQSAAAATGAGAPVYGRASPSPSCCSHRAWVRWDWSTGAPTPFAGGGDSESRDGRSWKRAAPGAHSSPSVGGPPYSASQVPIAANDQRDTSVGVGVVILRRRKAGGAHHITSPLTSPPHLTSLLLRFLQSPSSVAYSHTRRFLPKTATATMRPPRIAILVFFITASLFLLFRALTSLPRSTAGASSYPATSKSTDSKSQSTSKSPKTVWGFMYYNTPFSLFPPNAAISLTEDNSTSFAARPAAFGPKLVSKGLSGQLWVGSGFAEDTLSSGGELGCSDLPGWGKVADNAKLNKALREAIPQAAVPKTRSPSHFKRDDDYLAPRDTNKAQNRKLKPSTGNVPNTHHYEEIEGKIALLMRGGCGFLDKVMWAQRRGAIGVIVGDNQKGGPLIQMFAHGPEVDNVTIPSVFTARTTAQLLSSLTQPGSFIEETLDDQGNPILRVQRGSKSKKNYRKQRKALQSRTPGFLGRRRTTLASDIRKRFNSLFFWARSADSATAKNARSAFSSETSHEDEDSFLAQMFSTKDEVEEGYDATTNDVNAPDTPVHEGLWVTITPTSNASPFFDTLLVLVISPLVTLTVVYAMLILRARIRRRRWRAPKSVVERLPVRTYHTVARSPSLTPRTASPTSSSPTTPLLQDCPRPHSRANEGPVNETLLAPSAAIPTPSSGSRNPPKTEREKGAGGFSAEWKKYMGRQVECVVCLEEYVDGESQVMSLPCGHEFHADCITPWLTTRRRTCPICKGDVVRSLAHASSSDPHYEPYRDDSDEEDEPIAEASGSRAADHESDLEQGLLSPEPRPSRGWARHEGWLSVFSSGFTNRTRSPEDRSR